MGLEQVFAIDTKSPYIATATLLFTARNEAGSLAQALTIIGKHGFNMRTLRSRPMKELLWEYYFYVEAEGNIQTEAGQSMLEELSEFCEDAESSKVLKLMR